jgi:hypothetical protein
MCSRGLLGRDSIGVLEVSIAALFEQLLCSAAGVAESPVERSLSCSFSAATR